MRGYWSIFRHDVFPIFFRELPANVRMQRNVKRADLYPQSVKFLAEIIRRHVVIGAPHGTDVCKTHFLGALIAEFHEPGIALAHRGSNRVPSLPGSKQFLGVMAFGKDFFDVRKLLAVLLFVVRTPRTLAIVTVE